ncbi:hypothetical protein [Streptomyces sp. NPDC047928]|uniref:hypothetical protein n=1 Tax=unclassified Streptomyces TaxID=2593676 RepID=UPI003723FDBF
MTTGDMTRRGELARHAERFPDLSPECCLDECALCPGPIDVWLPGRPRRVGDRPVLTVPCAHACHRKART